jgi:hypothetical protein
MGVHSLNHKPKTRVQIADKDAAHAARPNKRPRIVDPPPLPPPGNCQGPPGNGTLEIARVRQNSKLALTHTPPHPRVGVGVLLLQEGRPGYVLVGRRKGSHGSGLCQLPVGQSCDVSVCVSIGCVPERGREAESARARVCGWMLCMEDTKACCDVLVCASMRPLVPEAA